MARIVTLLFDGYDLYNDMEQDRVANRASSFIASFSSVEIRSQKAAKFKELFKIYVLQGEQIVADAIIRFDPITFTFAEPKPNIKTIDKTVSFGSRDTDQKRKKIVCLFSLLKTCARYQLGQIKDEESARAEIRLNKNTFNQEYESTEKNKMFLQKIDDFITSVTQTNIIKNMQTPAPEETKIQPSEAPSDQIDIGALLQENQALRLELQDQKNKNRRLSVENESLKNDIKNVDIESARVNIAKSQVAELIKEIGMYSSLKAAIQKEIISLNDLTETIAERVIQTKIFQEQEEMLQRSVEQIEPAEGSGQLVIGLNRKF